MPRPLPPENAGKAVRQARYRKALAAKREPEADRVDSALAASVAAFAEAMDEPALASEARKEVLRLLVRSAVKILISEGFDKEAIIKVLRRRFSSVARPDLEKLAEASRIRSRLAAT